MIIIITRNLTVVSCRWCVYIEERCFRWTWRPRDVDVSL